MCVCVCLKCNLDILMDGFLFRWLLIWFLFGICSFETKKSILKQKIQTTTNCGRITNTFGLTAECEWTDRNPLNHLRMETRLACGVSNSISIESEIIYKKNTVRIQIHR